MRVIFFNIELCEFQKRDGTYTGFVKVHFQLVRPISLPPLESVRCNQGEAQQDRWMRRRTSFYLPKDAAKHLHISSHTRVREVIEALLKKFTVVDNPAKFALFEHTERQSQGINSFIKLLITEHYILIHCFFDLFSMHAETERWRMSPLPALVCRPQWKSDEPCFKREWNRGH